MRSKILFLAALVLFSCHGKKHEESSVQTDSTDVVKEIGVSQNSVAIERDSVLIPPFEIEISLTDEATRRLDNPKESIMVLVEFTGEPVDTVIVRDSEDDGEPFMLKSVERELYSPWKLKIENQKISKDKNFTVSAQVWTGRHTSDLNLIRGTFLTGTIGEIKNKKHTITADLIE